MATPDPSAAGVAPDFTRVTDFFGEIAFEHLGKRRVVIIGLGSVGGPVAVELAKLGVRRFLLIDPDIFEAHNIVRHVCDLRHVGMNKVDAVAEMILNRNPDATVIPLAGDVRDYLDHILDDDVVIVGVDSEAVKHIINQELWYRGIPALYAGVYPKAVAGDVWFVDPRVEDGPCYACLASQLAQQPESLDGVELDYGAVDEFGALKAEPGLGIHIGEINLRLADWAVIELLRETEYFLELPGNVCFVANRPYKVAEDSQGRPIVLTYGGVLWHNAHRIDGCRICNPAQPEVHQDGLVSVDDILRSL